MALLSQESFVERQGSSANIPKDLFFSLKTRWDIFICQMCVNEKHLISWLEREHKEEEMNEAAESVSSVPRLFAAISIHILFQEGGVHGDACRAWSSPAPPAFTPPLFWKLPTPGSSGDVITVQSTCKTHSPGECISLIDHSWLLFLTARIRKWLFCSFPLLKCIPRHHNQEKMIVIHKMYADNQRAGWKISWVRQWVILPRPETC